MKNILLIFVMILAAYTNIAQVTYYKGEWTMKNKHDLFTGIFKIGIKKDGNVTGQFVWTFLAADSTNSSMVDMYSGKKGMSGIEYVEGNFNGATNDFYFEGKSKDDPNNILGLDKYHLKLAASKQAIYGSTETEGTNEGMLFAVKLTNDTGEKEFMAAKEEVKKL
jgi:hypothetical protein